MLQSSLSKCRITECLPCTLQSGSRACFNKCQITEHMQSSGLQVSHGQQENGANTLMYRCTVHGSSVQHVAMNMSRTC